MSKILDWIKAHKVATIFIILGAFFLPLVFVHIAYRISAVTPWFSSTWNSGDLITYFAGFEAFFGTVFLGAITVRQNDKANELNTRMIKNEELRGVFERQPNLIIEKSIIQPFFGKYNPSNLDYILIPRDCSAQEYISNCLLYQISFELLNVSNTYASIMIIDMDMYILDKQKNSAIHKRIIFDKYLYDDCISIYNIAPKKTETVSFLVDRATLFTPLMKIFHLHIRISNSVGEIYIETISLTTRNAPGSPVFEVVSHIIMPIKDETL